MPTKIPAKFKAADGGTFDTAEEAERHEKLVIAQSNLDAAVKEYERCLWDGQNTADDQPFELGRTDYWLVHSLGRFQPCIERVHFWWYQISLGDDDEPSLLVRTEDPKQPYRVIQISDLYSTEQAAREAQLRAMKERAEWLAEDIDKLAKRIGV